MKIGKYCIIAEDVEIGEGTIIGNFCELKSGTKIGSNCKIGSYTVIDGAYLMGGVTLQGRNRIGANSVICPNVEIKYNAILTSNVLVGANTFIGVGAITLGSDIERVQIAGTRIGENCYIGGQSLIAPGITIPDNTTLGANSYLRECTESGTYVGNPAKLK